MERRLDTWLETGRQLVDGVSGRRPGQRRTSLDLDSMGRWVGEKVEWLLDDDDDWREPWQDQALPDASRKGASGSSSRLHTHFSRIVKAANALRPGRTAGVMECTVMNKADMEMFTSSAKECGLQVQGPFLLDAKHWSHVTRPRLWWIVVHLMRPPILNSRSPPPPRSTKQAFP